MPTYPTRKNVNPNSNNVTPTAAIPFHNGSHPPNASTAIPKPKHIVTSKADARTIPIISLIAANAPTPFITLPARPVSNIITVVAARTIARTPKPPRIKSLVGPSINNSPSPIHIPTNAVAFNTTFIIGSIA